MCELGTQSFSCGWSSPRPPRPASSPAWTAESCQPHGWRNSRFAQLKNFCTNCQKTSQVIDVFHRHSPASQRYPHNSWKLKASHLLQGLHAHQTRRPVSVVQDVPDWHAWQQVLLPVNISSLTRNQSGFVFPSKIDMLHLSGGRGFSWWRSFNISSVCKVLNL